MLEEIVACLGQLREIGCGQGGWDERQLRDELANAIHRGTREHRLLAELDMVPARTEPGCRRKNCTRNWQASSTGRPARLRRPAEPPLPDPRDQRVGCDLYPPVWFNGRKAAHDGDLRGHPVRSGDKLWDPALPRPPGPALVPRSGCDGPGPVSSRGDQAQAQEQLFPIRWREPPVHRSRLRRDGGLPVLGHTGTVFLAGVAAGPSSETRRPHDAPASRRHPDEAGRPAQSPTTHCLMNTAIRNQRWATQKVDWRQCLRNGFRGSLIRQLVDAKRKHGDFLSIKLIGPARFHVLSDPEAIEQVMGTNAEKLRPRRAQMDPPAPRFRQRPGDLRRSRAPGQAQDHPQGIHPAPESTSTRPWWITM